MHREALAEHRSSEHLLPPARIALFALVDLNSSLRTSSRKTDGLAEALD